MAFADGSFFGPSDHEKVMKKMTEIQNDINGLSQSVMKEFGTMTSVILSQQCKNGLAGPEKVILNALEDLNRLFKARREAQKCRRDCGYLNRKVKRFEDAFLNNGKGKVHDAINTLFSALGAY